MTRWLTVTEYARQAGVNRRTAQRWAREGVVGARRTKGGHWRLNAAYLEPRELTVSEVAATIGRSERTVRSWCESGRLPARRVSTGSRWLIGRAETERLLAVENDGDSMIAADRV